MGNLSPLDLQNRIATGGFGTFGTINSTGGITGASLRSIGTNNFNGSTNMTGFLAVDGNVNFNAYARMGGGVSVSGARLEILQVSAGTPIISLFSNGVGRVPITFDTGNYGFLDFHSDSSNGVRLSCLNTGPIIIGQNNNSAFASLTFASGMTITSGTVYVRNDLVYGANESVSGNIASISGNNADALDYGNSSGSSMANKISLGGFATASTSYVADGSNDSVSVTLSQSGILVIDYNCIISNTTPLGNTSGWIELRFNSVQIAENALNILNINSSLNNYTAALSLNHVLPVSAGTHTIDVRFKSSSGSSTYTFSARNLRVYSLVRNG